MTSYAFLIAIVTIALGLMLTACGEQQISVGASVGGTGQPSSLGGGTLPISPLPSLDDDDLPLRYVVWAPDAHTQECEGLDLNLHLLNQSNRQILPHGYASELQFNDDAEQHNIDLELHIQPLSQGITEPVQICAVHFKASLHESLVEIKDLSCKVLTTTSLDEGEKIQVISLPYTLALESATWNMKYEARYVLDGETRICSVQAIPLVVDAI